MNISEVNFCNNSILVYINIDDQKNKSIKAPIPYFNWCRNLSISSIAKALEVLIPTCLKTFLFIGSVLMFTCQSHEHSSKFFTGHALYDSSLLLLTACYSASVWHTALPSSAKQKPCWGKKNTHRPQRWWRSGVINMTLGELHEYRIFVKEIPFWVWISRDFQKIPMLRDKKHVRVP